MSASRSYDTGTIDPVCCWYGLAQRQPQMRRPTKIGWTLLLAVARPRVRSNSKTHLIADSSSGAPFSRQPMPLLCSARPCAMGNYYSAELWIPKKMDIEKPFETDPWESIQPAPRVQPMKPGNYPAAVTKIEYVRASTGTEGVTVAFEILEGGIKAKSPPATSGRGA